MFSKIKSWFSSGGSAETYWRDQLPYSLKSTYDCITDALKRGNSSCPSYTSDSNDMLACFSAATYDNPQYFWVSPKYKYIISSQSGTTMSFKSLYSGLKIPAIRRECDRIAAAVRGSTAIETEKNIADFIVSNVTYRVNNIYNQNAASALYFKEAQCSGIANAVKYLFDKNGIWCIITEGYLSKKGSHAWNIVNIDGNYYHFDATAMLGYNEGNTQITYDFINYSDSQLTATHKWNRSKVPACPGSMPIGQTQQTGSSCSSSGGNTPHRHAGSQASAWSPHSNPNAQQTASASGTTKPQSNIPPGTDIFNNMSQFRTAINKVLSSKQQSYTCAVTAGANVNDRLKLVSSSISMVAGMLNIGVSYNINVSDTLCEITLQY